LVIVLATAWSEARSDEVVAKSLFVIMDEEWATLSKSQAAIRALRSWDVAAAPRVKDLGELVNVIHERGHEHRSDRLLFEIVMRAATNDLASRTALQCMTPAMRSLRLRYRSYDKRPDLESAIVVETLAKIRKYPIERRPEHIAANIARDVQQVFWRSVVGKTAPRDGVAVGITDEVHDDSGFANSTDEVVALLKEGMTFGAVSKSEAALILATRVFDQPSESIAQSKGIAAQSVRKSRRRGERKLEAVAIEL
jgi:hypothetical protein